MKRLNFLLIATTIASIMFAKTPALTLHKAFMVCIPDGVAKTDGTEPWTSTWIPMTAEKTSNTVHEMTAFFQLAFNDEYFWIAAQQKGNSTIDTDAVAIPNSWERDNFEVFISLDTTSWEYGGAYGEAQFQFREQRASTFPWGYDDYKSAYTNNPTGWAIGNVDAGDGSFVEEWQIPWSALEAVTVDSNKFNGNFFKFDIQASDNTTGMPGGLTDQVFWASNTGKQTNNTEYLGLIYLASSCACGCKKSASIDPNGILLQPDCVDVKAMNMPNIAIVYPNPANESINISNETTLKFVTIRNILGEVKASIAVNNEKTINIPISDLACGIYLVTISDKSGRTYNSKFIKR